jgi:hypothetical protein
LWRFSFIRFRRLCFAILALRRFFSEPMVGQFGRLMLLVFEGRRENHVCPPGAKEKIGGQTIRPLA